jgi:hypothetical protein
MERLIRDEDFIGLGRDIHRLFMADDIIGLNKLRSDIYDYLEEQKHTHMAKYIYEGIFRYLLDYINHAMPAVEHDDFSAQIIWDKIYDTNFIAEKFDYYINTYITNMPEEHTQYWYVYGYTLTLTEGIK